jgi:hypothetical protein
MTFERTCFVDDAPDAGCRLFGVVQPPRGPWPTAAKVTRSSRPRRRFLKGYPAGSTRQRGFCRLPVRPHRHARHRERHRSALAARRYRTAFTWTWGHLHRRAHQLDQSRRVLRRSSSPSQN